MNEKRKEDRKKTIRQAAYGVIISIAAICVGAYAGYGALHLLQGIYKMSSPILLFNSYLTATAFSTLVIFMSVAKWE